jgi:cephalosporin-C deacetylase-like acetyl esterase
LERLKSDKLISSVTIPAFLLLITVSSSFSPVLRAQRAEQEKKQTPVQIVFDEMEPGPGLERGVYRYTDDHRPVVKLIRESTNGRTDMFLTDQSAEYDVTLTCYDTPDGASLVNLHVNDKSEGIMMLDASGEGVTKRELTVTGVNIQKWSKISLVVSGNGAERCLLEKLTLTKKGEFTGTMKDIENPLLLKVFETGAEQQRGRHMLGDFINKQNDVLMKRRMEEIGKQGNPAAWAAKQKAVRDNLSIYFGPFPERTSLNPIITGKIEHPGYTIEKIIFESQPGYYVTSNFYVPKGRVLPQPGVLFTCGHSKFGKGSILYHETCLGLVLKGYVVLAIDPMGQGERSEYVDPLTGKDLVNQCMDQHHYLGRPSYLLGWTLAGLRTWDAIRAIDYLCSRTEVDTGRIAVVGNSGGGQMAMLITAADQRVKVCAAAHPGGPMENTFLKGNVFGDREIFSLIPPRPLRIIAGRDSGEEPAHKRKLEDMIPFYHGLGFGNDYYDLEIVDGVHNMERPKRESAYEWLNKWFGKMEEGRTEPVLNPETTENLWCTNSGNTWLSLGGETGQTLNVKRAEKMYKPEIDISLLRNRVLSASGLRIPHDGIIVKATTVEKINADDILVEKLIYKTEEGILIPALLLKPLKPLEEGPVIIHCSDLGKPSKPDDNSLPFLLARNGLTVLSIDVRGTGETSPVPAYYPPGNYWRMTGRNDASAIQSTASGRNIHEMKTLDIIYGIRFVKSLKEFEDRNIVVAGEGAGGLWCTLAAAYDPSIKGVITAGTLPSFKLLVRAKYYNVWSYFWFPGVLKDFDIPDLVRLTAPKKQLWIDPVGATGMPLNASEADSLLGSHTNMNILIKEGKYDRNFVNLLLSELR